MNDQELNAKFQHFEHQIRQLQEQLRSVDQAIFDMSTISRGIEDLKGKKDEEILAPIGRGIFVKAKLLSEDLTVDVGGNNYVKKTIDETKLIIKEQKEKLSEIKKSIELDLNKIDEEITSVMMEYQKATHQ